MRSFEISGLFGCGRNKESLCLNLSVSGRVLALGLGFGLGFGLVIPEAAQAVCVATPDCASLGYTASSCASGGVKCPWDTSKLFCGCGAAYVYSCTGTGYSGGVGDACGGKYVSCNCASGYSWSGSSCIACGSAYKYTCTGSNEAGGSGTACGGKYASCTCASGYAWNGSRCAQNCMVGYILNSDRSCTLDKVSGKRPMGVVSYINGSKRIAIQLDAPSSTMQWGCGRKDISGITNTSSSTCLNDFNGKSNTSAWMSECNVGTSYAPGYCNAYNTIGTSPGDWYLPAAGELYASVWTNKMSVNAGLSAAGGTAIVEDYHWSSSEITVYYTNHYAWRVNANSGDMSGSHRGNNCYVRCVLAF